MEGMFLVFLLGLWQFFFFLNRLVEYIIVYNKWFEFTIGDFIISVRLVEIFYFFYLLKFCTSFTMILIVCSEFSQICQNFGVWDFVTSNKEIATLSRLDKGGLR